MPLFGEQTARHGHEHSEQAESCTDHSVLVLFRTADHLLDIREGDEGDESHGVRTDHTESGEPVFLVVIGGHHIQQRSVGHVDHGVTGHHEQVERVRPNLFARIA